MRALTLGANDDGHGSQILVMDWGSWVSPRLAVIRLQASCSAAVKEEVVCRFQILSAAHILADYLDIALDQVFPHEDHVISHQPDEGPHFQWGQDTREHISSS